MALTLKIAGVDKTSLMAIDSLNVGDQLNARNTASFELVDTAGTYRPVMGSDVVIADTFVAPALAFNGGTGYASLPAIPDPFGADFTVEFWVYLNSLSIYRFVEFSNTTVSPALDNVTIQVGSSGTITAITTSGTTTAAQVNSTSNLAATTWSHVAVVMSGGGTTLTIYINGVAAGSGAASFVRGTPSSGMITNNRIGASYIGGGSQFLNGAMAEVRVWNVARTAAQIARDKSRRLTGKERGLVAYVPMDEGSGAVAGDESGNGATATLTGTTAWTTAGPTLDLRYFAGTIDNLEEWRLTPNSTGVGYAVEAVDYNQIPDRRLVAQIYDDPAGFTLYDLVSAINAEFLTGEGLDLQGVQDGPKFTKVVYNYASAASAFNEVSDLAGMDWFVDYWKCLYFFPREAFNAPFSLGDTTANFRDLVVKSNRDNYRNKQLLRGGMDLTSSPLTETYTGDGTRKTFQTGFSIAATPTITVNGVSKTVGIRGIDDNASPSPDWFWSKGEKEITQASGATALATTDTLAISYTGMYPIIVSLQNDAEVSARAAVEGGSGLYEDVIEDTSTESNSLATDKANALLRRYGRIAKRITFETDTAGLRAGMLLPVNLTKHAINATFLVSKVDVSTFGAGTLRFKVEALDGENIGGWEQFFKRMAASKQTFVIRENEVLVKVQAKTETVTLTDTLTTSTSTAASVAGSVNSGLSKVDTLDADFNRTGWSKTNTVATSNTIALTRSGSNFTDTDTAQADFNAGTLTNVTATAAGDLTLAQTPALNADGTQTKGAAAAYTTALSAYTVEFWINANSLAGNRQWVSLKAGAWGCFTMHTDGGTNGLYCGTDVATRFDPTGGSGTSSATNGMLAGVTGTWIHLAFTYGSGTFSVYKNGTLVASHAATAPVAPDTIQIGNGPTNSLDGSMQEFRLWNVARTQAQIQSTMNQRLVGNETGLVALYPLTEGTGTTSAQLVAGGPGSLSLVNGMAWTASGMYQPSGTWVSAPINPSSAVNVLAATSSRTATVPANTTLSVDVRVSTDGGTTWGAYQTGVASGGAITALPKGTVLTSNHRIQTRVNLAGNMLVTPTLSDITTSVTTGYNTSGSAVLEMPLAGGIGTANNSLISWSTTNPASTTTTVSTAYSTDNGTNWSAYSSEGSGTAINNLAAINANRLRVKVDLATTDVASTPTLNDLTVVVEGSGPFVGFSEVV